MHTNAGWFTVKDYAKQNQIHPSTARQRLNALVKQGLVENKVVRLKRELGTGPHRMPNPIKYYFKFKVD